ncbi:tripeptidyl-peptidase 2 [Brachionus plicatilis]|uniref:Tripeptidyl-peptidase 2 n=1 Tax=Brachionus plicatilis TaxID=10195 RepID=A0A3M7T9S8_BRAPC|nr:tripeptidyl-peptidase 2 [Brachionus plicatilis]
MPHYVGNHLKKLELDIALNIDSKIENSKYTNKKEALRIRMYAFSNENRSLGKIFTVRQLMAEKIPRSTVYRILKRSEYCSPERKQGSGQTPKKITKVQLNKLKKAFDHKYNISQRQAATKSANGLKIVEEASNNT